MSEMGWQAYGLTFEKVVCVYNIYDDDNKPGVGVDIALTPKESKKLRKLMKAAEKAARGG